MYNVKNEFTDEDGDYIPAEPVEKGVVAWLKRKLL